MSVVVRDEEGQILLLCKGADRLDEKQKKNFLFDFCNVQKIGSCN